MYCLGIYFKVEKHVLLSLFVISITQIFSTERLFPGRKGGVKGLHLFFIVLSPQCRMWDPVVYQHLHSPRSVCKAHKLSPNQASQLVCIAFFNLRKIAHV